MQKNKTFGEALAAVKSGHRISREGWNGKNMFVTLNKGSSEFLPPVAAGRKEYLEGIDTALFNLGDEGTVTRLPNLYLKSASGSNATWAPSITDTLAEDWCIHGLN